MLINFTNHPSDRWSREQMAAAQALYGEVRDLPFPAVPVTADAADVREMATREIEKINTLLSSPGKNAVLCQGEFTLAFQVTLRLLSEGVEVISAVSERNVREIAENGMTKKEVVFSFEGFRKYTL